MLDRKLIRDAPEQVKAALVRRGTQFAASIDRLVQIDEQRRKAQQELDTLRAEKNAASKHIGELMKAGQRDEAEQAKLHSAQLGDTIDSLTRYHGELESEADALALDLPNLPHDSIPTGGEDAAQIVKESPVALRTFDFSPRDHVELCSQLQLVNFEAGARLAGGGFPVMHGTGAMLQRALINLMLDVHITKHGYTELRPPFIVHPRCPLGTGQLPKFGSEMYHVYVAQDETVGQASAPADDGGQGRPPQQEAEGPHFYLIPTAEVPVVNYYREQILDAPSLPVKLCAYSPCWRVEAGSYGKEARGLTRLHQFEKVELVRIADPEHSWDDLEEMTAEAEAILSLLGLAYRRKLLPSGDMAFGSAKTYDLEVYCPAEQAWREVSSASNTTDWQARRANIRFRRERGTKPEFPHLLNASGLALPRLMIALLETWQTADGSVAVPEQLRPYLGGLERITPPAASAPPLV